MTARRDRPLPGGDDYPKSVPQWIIEDICDMMTHYQFWRCRKCGCVAPQDFCCPNCGYDDTDYLEAQAEKEEQEYKERRAAEDNKGAGI